MATADVVVAGAGPAGAATALALANLGHSVDLVDLPRRVPARGEVLRAVARDALERLGLWDDFAGLGFPPSMGTVSAWGDEEPVERSAILDPFGPGWDVDRDAFEAMLVGRARTAGVRLVSGQVVAATPSGERWRLTVRTASGPVPLGPAVAVDATGRRALLARRCGARQAVDRLVAVVHALSDGPAAEPVLTVESEPDGWWYTVPAAGGLVAAYFTDADLWRDGGSAAPNGRLTARRYAGRRSLGRAVVRPAASACTTARRAGLVPVGDACMSVDPLSSDGLCFALVSAREAATTVSAVLRGDRDALDRYHDGVARVFAGYLAQREAVYAGETRWPDRPFWQRRHR
jgi:2-polyprenyl-6-methoxyphenol hydroxylase-like FAD-dependent oxidoreductase